MAQRVSTDLAAGGWSVLGTRTHYTAHGVCAGAGCSKQCLQDLKAARAVGGKQDTCSKCECSLCSPCASHATRWRAPSGQVVESLTTRTEPRFNFAYSPFDDDMRRMTQTRVVEPGLTTAWHQATWACCNRTGGYVVDVGGNFGWYTLYSIALGCSVVVFEPVPAFHEILRLGVALNPGFGARVGLYENVVYDTPGSYTLRVPKNAGKRRKKWGMTSMGGSSGYLKTNWNSLTYNHTARSVRLDDVVPASAPVCMLKADVEGYEPQVLHTARALLASGRVEAVQLELTKTPGKPEQTAASLQMLEGLHGGFELKQVTNKVIDRQPPPVGTWREQGPWDALPDFPSSKGASIQAAYRADVTTHSTNLIGRARRRPR